MVKELLKLSLEEIKKKNEELAKEKLKTSK